MSTTASWITKDPNRCGGDACIRDTRVTVWGLVEWRQFGKSADWIRDSIPGITESDLEAAWEYYASHREEIEDAIRQNAEG